MAYGDVFGVIVFNNYFFFSNLSMNMWNLPVSL